MDKMEDNVKRYPSHKGGLYHENVFQILMDFEIVRSIRYPTPMSLICFEMKYHASGEEEIQSTVSMFETAFCSRLRSVDIPVRHEGKYFILLPMTDEAGALVVCNRLVSIFEDEFRTEHDNFIQYSLHVGVASHKGGATLMKETLIQAAESSLQESRLKGENSIVAIG
jgi:hypothetical protein